MWLTLAKGIYDWRLKVNTHAPPVAMANTTAASQKFAAGMAYCFLAPLTDVHSTC
jgi:hypothetical protein